METSQKPKVGVRKHQYIFFFFFSLREPWLGRSAGINLSSVCFPLWWYLKTKGQHSTLSMDGGPFSRGMDGNRPKIDVFQAELHEAVQSSRMILVLQSSPCKPPPAGVGALGCL